jgi:hypothetical protein
MVLAAGAGSRGGAEARKNGNGMSGFCLLFF